MNLKESYRYSNFLDTLLDSAYAYLQTKGFVTTTTQEHLRSKTNNDVSDETVETKKPFDVDFTPNDIINFIVKVINEKESLYNAIAIAKSNTEINIDNSVALNKKKQYFVSVLKGLVNIKPGERVITGKAFKFNNDGNQVPYCYDINEKTQIDFNRNDVRNLIKKYLKETDAISSKLDAIEINTIVDFDPKYDINDNFEELVKI